MTRRSSRLFAAQHGIQAATIGAVHAALKRRIEQSGRSSKRARMAAMETDSKEGASRGDFDGSLIPGVDGIKRFGFPNSIITKLRYVDYYELDSTNGTVALNVFRMNSVFDPDATGVGHQPIYFDTYAAIYSRYRVLGSILMADFSPVPTAADGTFGPYWCGINGAYSTTSVSSTPSLRAEMSDSTNTLMNQETGPVSLTWSFNPEDALGIATGDDVNQAAVGNNPSNQYYGQVWVADINAPESSKVIVKVTLEYTVSFFQPNPAIQS